MRTLGGNIKHFREENGWTRAELAEMIGVTANAIKYWECEERIPNCMYVMPMVKVFQIRLEDLFRGL